METSELVNQGLELALLGMGTVFAFLTFLVLGTGAMSWIVQRFVLEEPTAPAFEREGAGAEEEGAVVAAIAAALRMHRAGR